MKKLIAVAVFVGLGLGATAGVSTRNHRSTIQAKSLCCDPPPICPPICDPPPSGQ